MNSQQRKANCKFLTHKHASFFGCTLQEALVITCIFLAGNIFLSILSMIFLGSFFLSFVILFIFSIFLIKITAQHVGRFKIGRQEGYLSLLFLKILHEKFNLEIPFVDREGRWLTRRSIKC